MSSKIKEAKKNAENLEIERKFLLEKIPHGISRLPHKRIAQTYLLSSKNNEIRLRKEGSQHILTLKRGNGISREENELKISKDLFNYLWKSAPCGSPITKTRYILAYGGRKIEIDVFSGRLSGLITAEIEFESVEAARKFKPLPWFGNEITFDENYKNKNLWNSINNRAEGIFSLEKGVQVLNAAVDALVTLKKGRGQVIVLIASGSYSKETAAIAKALASHLNGDALLLSTNNYYLGKMEALKKKKHGVVTNSDRNEAIYNTERLYNDLRKLKHGTTIQMTVRNHKLLGRNDYMAVDPKSKKAVIVEGLFMLTDPLIDISDLSVYVDSSTYRSYLGRPARQIDNADIILQNKGHLHTQ